MPSNEESAYVILRRHGSHEEYHVMGEVTAGSPDAAILAYHRPGPPPAEGAEAQKVSYRAVSKRFWGHLITPEVEYVPKLTLQKS